MQRLIVLVRYKGNLLVFEGQVVQGPVVQGLIGPKCKGSSCRLLFSCQGPIFPEPNCQVLKCLWSLGLGPAIRSRFLRNSSNYTKESIYSSLPRKNNQEKGSELTNCQGPTQAGITNNLSHGSTSTCMR